ncbi:MAG: hypothetical protein OEL76_10915 [Siculibacillus sp.]|nr:hypothetical protein [Siculibacillus sp.]
MRVRLTPFLRATAVAAFLASAPLPAAAQATPEEAARLQAIGELYFGKSPVGEAGVVKVEPEGDHYRASLDIAALLRRLVALAPDEEARKLTIDWAPVSTALAPQPDGLWRFWDHRIGKLVTAVDGQRTEVDVSGVDFTSILDPATGASPKLEGRFARISATSTINKPGEDISVSSENTSVDVALSGSTRPTGTPGVLDAEFRQITGSLTYGLGITGGGAKGVPDMRFTLNGGRQEAALGMRGFRNAALLDLWAHLVAHHSREDLTTGQGALKAKIAAALPIFEDLRQKVEGKDFSFESAFAVANAEKVAIDLDLAGLTRDGRFGMAIGVAGFQAFSIFMPKWANKLMPRDIALAGHVSGYDFATPISVFLDEADFTATKPLTPEKEARIATLMLPRGAVDVNLDGNRLVSALYDVSLDGRLKAGPTGAKGAISVTARGIEKVAEHLAAPGADEYARAAAGMIAVARGFAERKGDTLVWRIDFEGEAVSVNGKPLK